jgi:hypothetical protein
MHVPEYSLKLSRPLAHHSAVFSIVVVGNQIADSALVVTVPKAKRMARILSFSVLAAIAAAQARVLLRMGAASSL